MKRFNYSKIVKQVNQGEIMPRQFIERLFGPGFNWCEAWAAYRIFLENGGKIPPEEFFKGLELNAPKEISIEDFLRADV